MLLCIEEEAPSLPGDTHQESPEIIERLKNENIYKESDMGIVGPMQLLPGFSNPYNVKLSTNIVPSSTCY
jgi:hypothetical protein